MFKSKWFWIICGLIAGYWMLKDTYEQVQKAAAPDPDSYQPKKDYMVITETDSIGTLDTLKITNQTEMNIANNVFEGLMRLGKDNQPVYGMAEKYEVSPDYRTYTFYIRKDAKWSDGVPVTAHDFKYAWLRALDPRTESPYYSLFFVIKNAQNYYEGKAKAEDVGIEVINDHVLVVKLEYVSPYFTSLVAYPAFFPQRKDVEKEVSQFKLGSKNITGYRFNGPFIVENLGTDGSILKMNSRYWDYENVKVNRIKITNDNNYYNEENTDLILSNNEDANKNFTNKHEVKQSQTKVYFLVFNHNKLDLNARKSLINKIILNRKKILENAGIDFNITNYLIPELIRDLIKINQLKIELIENNNFIKKDKIKILVINNKSQKKLGEVLSKYLSNEFGLKSELVVVDLKDVDHYIKNNNFSILIYNKSAKYYDPISFLEIFTTNSENKFYDNKEFDYLINRAKNEADIQKRNKLIEEAEKILLQKEYIVLPLYYPSKTWQVSDNVKNVYFHPFGPDYTLKWASYTPQK